MSTNQSLSANDLLWRDLGGSPADMMFWCAMAAAATAIVVTMIWSHAFTYFEHFGRKDHALAVLGVGCGTTICTAYLIMICVQVYKLSRHAYTDYASIAHFDNLCVALLAAVGSLFTLVGCVFYSWRAYKLWGEKKWFLPFLAVVIITPFAWTFPLLQKSAAMPHITIESLTDRSFKWWSEDMKLYWRVWQALTFGGCLVVGALLLTVLNKPRTSLFSVEKRVYRRLTSLVMETMLPPIISLIVLEGCNALPGAPIADWRRALYAVVSPLYFLSVLHSLVARLDIRRILNKELSDHGVEVSNGSGTGAGKVVVSHPSESDRTQSPINKEWEGGEEPEQFVRYQ